MIAKFPPQNTEVKSGFVVGFIDDFVKIQEEGTGEKYEIYKENVCVDPVHQLNLI